MLSRPRPALGHGIKAVPYTAELLNIFASVSVNAWLPILRGLRAETPLRVIYCFIVTWAFLLTGMKATAAVPSAEEVLRAAIEARGGCEAFSNIVSFSATGTVSFYTSAGPWADAPWVTNVWPVEICATRSNQFRFSTDLSSTSGASSIYTPFRYYPNGCDGQIAWESVPGRSPVLLTGIFAQERRQQAQLFAWCAEAQHYLLLTNLGEVSFEGRRCYALDLVGIFGNRETHYYDLQSHLLAGVERRSVFGPSLERFIFEEYRAYGGFKFPVRVRYLGTDARPMMAVEELDYVEVNQPIRTDFSMPRGSSRLSKPPTHSSLKTQAEDARNLLRDWIDTDKLGEGVQAGYLDETGRWLAFAGRCSPWHDSLGQWGSAIAKGLHLARAPKVDESTVFPLASISKVFTRLLLLDMVQRGEMSLDDPVQLYLPEMRGTPAGTQITLLHLATHTAGLPRYIPGSERDVYSTLRKWVPGRRPGTQFEYSNTGAGLLGKAIERKAGKSYGTLVRERICKPLALSNTRVLHSTFPGIDGVASTSDDLLTFASGCLGLKPVPQPLGALMQHEFAAHPGGSERFNLELIIDPAHRAALVVLWSRTQQPYSQVPQSIKRLVMGQPIRPAITPEINGSACASYAGQYLMQDNSVWSVRRSGDRLLLQKVCRESYEIFPTSKTGFTNTLAAVGVVFQSQTRGEPMKVTIHTTAGTTQGSRIRAHTPVRGAKVRPDSRVTSACVGRYEDSKKQMVVVRCVGRKLLIADPACSGEQELIAESDTSYVCAGTTMSAWTFVPDDNGNVTELIRHNMDSHTRFSRITTAAPAISSAKKPGS